MHREPGEITFMEIPKTEGAIFKGNRSFNLVFGSFGKNAKEPM